MLVTDKSAVMCVEHQNGSSAQAGRCNRRRVEGTPPHKEGSRACPKRKMQSERQQGHSIPLHMAFPDSYSMSPRESIFYEQNVAN